MTKAEKKINEIGIEKAAEAIGVSVEKLKRCIKRPGFLTMHMLEKSHELYGLILGDWQ